MSGRKFVIWVFDLGFSLRFALAAPRALLLRRRALRLQAHLQRRGVACRVNQHYRDRATAHRWSTAHQLRIGAISLGDLRTLPEGRDRNGNLWLHSNWDPSDLPDGAPANDVSAIRTHAQKLGPESGAYAEEGYVPSDPRREPNAVEIPVSAHVLGLAIDLAIDWDGFGGPWTPQARELVRQFGLARPVPAEPWHFTLPQTPGGIESGD